MFCHPRSHFSGLRSRGEDALRARSAAARWCVRGVGRDREGLVLTAQNHLEAARGSRLSAPHGVPTVVSVLGCGVCPSVLSRPSWGSWGSVPESLAGWGTKKDETTTVAGSRAGGGVDAGWGGDPPWT